MSNATEIIRQALAAHTVSDAKNLQAAIEADIGSRFQRPISTWNNFGLMSQTGDFDHKTIEHVTNAQDAILEREARSRFSSLADVPYRSPEEAAAELLAGQTELEKRIQVDFFEPDAGDLEDKRVTMSIRDDGCGMTAGDMSSTIFQLGSGHKSESYWQQGAFGIGAKSTFRNARAVVVVSRRAPEMDPAEDRIAVAVVLWEAHGKGASAYYLTTSDWQDGGNPSAEPWSAPASHFPEFGPGTQITLISYGVRGLHRRYSGDERAFHAIAQTRLFSPVIPFRHTSYLVKKPEPRAVYGLAARLAEDPGARLHNCEPLPFHIDGSTYQLPVCWWVFPAAANEPGGRNSLVAAQHVLVFTSGGQVHKHWDGPEFRERTHLNKLDSRIFVAVDTNELPIEIRTGLFSPDRSDTIPTDDAIRLESAVAAHLDGSAELGEINDKLLRAEVERALGNRNTRDVAKRISRAFRLRGGFSLAATNGDGGNRSPKKEKVRKQFDLYPEPTFIEGPESITFRPGETRSLTFYVNAEDAFMDSGQGVLELGSDHPKLRVGREIAVSDLRNGRMRLTVLVPDTADLGEYVLVARIPEWNRKSGGLGGPLSWETKLTITDKAAAVTPPPPPQASPTNSGGEIALLWANGSSWGFTPNIPGLIEDVPASILAADDDYQDLAQLGDTTIPTIVLNEEFADYKKYVSRIVGKRQPGTVDRNKDKYAQGVGVGLLVLQEQTKRSPLDADQRKAAAQAIARATLSLLPAFDEVMSRIDPDSN